MCALFGWLDYKGIVPYKTLKKLTQSADEIASDVIDNKLNAGIVDSDKKKAE